MLTNYKDVTKPLDFVLIGLSCHALCLAHKMGILNRIHNFGKFSDDDIDKSKNIPLAKAILNTLTASGIFKRSSREYCLTPLGESLYSRIGSITMPFAGYGQLLAKQFLLMDNPNAWNEADIDHNSIADSSVNFGENDLDPIIISIISRLNPKHTVCDLGCGSAKKLAMIARQFNVLGIGFDKSQKVVNAGRKIHKSDKRIELIQADICQLQGIWEDVEIGLVSFVMHDLHTAEASAFLHNLHNHFPRMKHLVVADIVTYSEKVPSIMPGFDYVHGLQGILPRTYEETIKLFEDVNLDVLEEASVPNMPNTFIWTLDLQKIIKKV